MSIVVLKLPDVKVIAESRPYVYGHWLPSLGSWGLAIGALRPCSMLFGSISAGCAPGETPKSVPSS
jgi:hypothetical protein